MIRFQGESFAQNILDLDVCHDSFTERIRNILDLDLRIMLHSLIPERVHNLYDLALSVVCYISLPGHALYLLRWGTCLVTRFTFWKKHLLVTLGSVHCYAIHVLRQDICQLH